MSIGTYAELRSAITNWLPRGDFTTDETTDTIALFEAVANRRLRVRQMETTTTLTPSSGEATLPTDYLAWKRLTWTGDVRQELQYVHPQYLSAAYPTSPSDIPNFFTIVGETIKIRPIDDTDLELDYYQKIPALADDATTNWLLTAHPDLYLFGSLVEANAFVQDERAMIWKARRDEIFNEIDALSAKTKGYTAMRVMGTVV
jgi:hypothetical protein